MRPRTDEAQVDEAQLSGEGGEVLECWTRAVGILGRHGVDDGLETVSSVGLGGDTELVTILASLGARNIVRCWIKVNGWIEGLTGGLGHGWCLFFALIVHLDGYDEKLRSLKLQVGKSCKWSGS